MGGLGWIGIARLGLVQAALGAIVVLTTSTLNRILVVELALPATLAGLLVGLHYAIQMLRPRWGYSSDLGGRRTPWIIGGMAVLGAGATLAAAATVAMPATPTLALAGLVAAFLLIGIGVGASGTSLLALLAASVAERRRAAAASIVWIMMIFGMAMTAVIAGKLLDPFTPTRLISVVAGVSLAALAVTSFAIIRIETVAAGIAAPDQERARFIRALHDVWAEPQARRFTVFVFVSMLAYSTQDLILEPFAGHVFGFTPGQSTTLAGMQHGGVLLGMILVALVGSLSPWRRLRSMRGWAIGGCLASAAALAGLVGAGATGAAWPLEANVVVLGIANGAFAVAAIGAMMALAGEGRTGREGTRMGLWGAAQALAFALGGLLGTVAIDAARALIPSVPIAYAAVFAMEALMFLAAAVLAHRVWAEYRIPSRASGAAGAAPGALPGLTGR